MRNVVKMFAAAAAGLRTLHRRLCPQEKESAKAGAPLVCDGWRREENEETRRRRGEARGGQGKEGRNEEAVAGGEDEEKMG